MPSPKKKRHTTKPYMPEKAKNKPLRGTKVNTTKQDTVPLRFCGDWHCFYE